MEWPSGGVHSLFRLPVLFELPKYVELNIAPVISD